MATETEFEKNMRLHSTAVREERRGISNDKRVAQGLAPLHCGVEGKLNDGGDYDCPRCGALGYF
ncbi:hypothetical protein [Streptomyces griseofuscus]|uniref:hypothetical protein n=1 Tax=Streptomyces griseofuscus TaxID=146922 RepID=UPI003409CB0F